MSTAWQRGAIHYVRGSSTKQQHWRRCCGGGAARGGYSYLWWFKLRQHPCAKWSGVVGLRLAARKRRATVQSLPLLTHCIRCHATVAAAAAVKPPLLRHRRALCTVQWGKVRTARALRPPIPRLEQASSSSSRGLQLCTLIWIKNKKQNENMFSIKLFLKYVFCIPV